MTRRPSHNECEARRVRQRATDFFHADPQGVLDDIERLVSSLGPEVAALILPQLRKNLSAEFDPDNVELVQLTRNVRRLGKRMSSSAALDFVASGERLPPDRKEALALAVKGQNALIRQMLSRGRFSGEHDPETP